MIIDPGARFRDALLTSAPAPRTQAAPTPPVTSDESLASPTEGVVLSEAATRPLAPAFGETVAPRDPSLAPDTKGSRTSAHASPESRHRHHDSPQAQSVRDNVTGQSFMLAMAPGTVGLTMLPDTSDAPPARRTSHAAPFSPTMAAGARQQLESLVQDCSWFVFGSDGGVTRTGKSGPVALPGREKTDAWMADLAADPAKGGKPTPGSVEEAAVGVYAELAGVAAPPIQREETGAAEFVDGKNVAWDVKSPKSPPEGAKWVFDAAHQLVKIRHDQSNGEVVMLNLSKCSPTDTRELLDLIAREMTDQERQNIVVLARNEALR